ncbi:hypothetical protein LUZ60_007137 [Juncus effusus]|nr:hypothetical protein LUZ60_007137 [Juncus effusus]
MAFLDGTSYIPDSSHWKKAVEAMNCSFSEEVYRMVSEFSNLSSLSLSGAKLSIAQIASIARHPNLLIHLDADEAQARVDESFKWMTEKSQTGASTHGVTTGFGSTSNRRTTKTSDLQAELIRFLNAGVIGKDYLPVSYAKSMMLVRTNMLMQGYSGIRWDLLDAMVKLMNNNLIPKLPLRGTVSGDLVHLSYIVGVLIGRDNSKVLTPEGQEISAIEALKRVGIDDPFELQAKEGLALVNGTSVCSSVAAIVCYDATTLVLLSVILSALFCEAMQGKPEFTDPLTHELKHHPGQIESASIMKFLLDGSDIMNEVKFRQARDPSAKSKPDRYALRTSPQWIGPQIETIRQATHSVEREINSVNDNPIIDVSHDMSIRGGNFQGTPIDVSMDNVRIALAAIGKLVFAQFSELVCDYYNNGLPSNLSFGRDLSLDYGLKGAEVAMASYCSELQFLANPVSTHVQSAEQHNQDVNSLGLISARQSAEAIEILQLMVCTYMVGLCQAIDLRHLEENLHEIVKNVVAQTIENVFNTSNDGHLSKLLMQIVEKQNVFSYIDDPSNPKNALISQLREILFEKALEKSDEVSIESISKFQEELKEKLESELNKARERFDNGDFTIGRRIEKCRTFPVYRFVRDEVGTEVLTGEKKVSPGEEIEKVFEAIKKGKVDSVLLDCLIRKN